MEDKDSLFDYLETNHPEFSAQHKMETQEQGKFLYTIIASTDNIPVMKETETNLIMHLASSERHDIGKYVRDDFYYQHVLNACYEKYGERGIVFEGKQAGQLWYDLFAFEPTAERPWWTLQTCGLALQKLDLGDETGLRREYNIRVYKEWPIHEVTGTNLELPIWIIDFISQKSIVSGAPFLHGETIGLPDETKQISKFNSALFTIDKEWDELSFAEENIVVFNVLPITDKELQNKFKIGSDSFIKLVNESHSNKVFSFDRPEMIAKKKWFGK